MYKRKTYGTSQLLACVMALLFIVLANVEIYANVELPSISSSKYISTYTYSSSGKVYAYTSSSLSTKTGGYIDCATDECRILEISGDSVKVSYPVSSGRKIAWFRRDAFTYRNLAKDKASRIFTARKKITTYKWKNNNTSYGYISKGDRCYLLRGDKSSKWLQILYPVTKGYKMAWVKEDVISSIWSDEEDNSKSYWFDYITVANKYGISSKSNAFAALKKIETTYRSKLNEKQKKGTLVFAFEGVGNSSSTSRRMNAMIVVLKNGKIKYLNRNSSTIPDYPFNPKKNGGTAMPTLRSGIYSFTTVNHKGSYAALNVANAKVVRFKKKNDGTYGTSTQINIHRRSTDSIAPVNKSWVNSAGCQLVGKSGTGANGEYAKFIKAVGIVGNSAKGNSKKSKSVTGKYIVDRTFAYKYLKSIGYTEGAISKIGR